MNQLCHQAGNKFTTQFLGWRLALSHFLPTALSHRQIPRVGGHIRGNCSQT
jgi:hypothetical protein